jgi:hypothetical protein
MIWQRLKCVQVNGYLRENRGRRGQQNGTQDRQRAHTDEW